ncbi:Mediator of RNA polymerase II transcription subunit 8 [Wickerhamomyces ciferrii]|uniref:Mediator of RNA polymerase II transcription subunit 8 n=1 Tax=Wickerhamomyces ciferrii (strain ATCC 14091 / BCRC 22168 / CBS 111 / JCM 3599 / NBRC 0793 / NRRL Y-1031 F-60-10) TaxID=1206466 RepID=K0KHM4_WICCF|nr:Mediator of RNA polymerase II transcription subunit 8 [Wickerhamomyces ciferrii]CCH44710.1 Mediator of RNA polymerase II transcription subunit 8 [Wickerhamomyces ciferrii]
MQAPTTQNEQNIDHSGVPIEALESLRLRLTQVNKCQIGDQVNIIFTQLASLSATLSTYSETLAKTVVYPLPDFPTTEQESLLTTLLRKKALPEVNEWIEDSKKKSTDILLKDDEDLTDWALNLVINQRDEHEFRGFHTKKEIDEQINEDDDIKIKQDFSRPKYSIDEVLKFMYQGSLPTK